MEHTDRDESELAGQEKLSVSVPASLSKPARLLLGFSLLFGLSGLSLAAFIYFDSVPRHDGARADRLEIRSDLGGEIDELGAEIDELKVSISSLRNDMEVLVRAAAADISQLEREINDLEDDVCGFSGCFGVESLQEEIERLSRCVRSFQDAADRIWSGYRSGQWYWCADRGL